MRDGYSAISVLSSGEVAGCIERYGDAASITGAVGANRDGL